ncbi:MAG TPA: DUF188 domain-containing protein [Rectinemataceae bacterium]|nr:DUF188 domain-containing protein [Rectinemataceae bacterium]
MTIWADADSLQGEIRDYLCRRVAHAPREGCALVFVSARRIRIRLKDAARRIVVEEGPQAADDRIASLSQSGDLAVTRDIPLAERLAEKGLVVLNDRGEVFTLENVRERRSLRDRALELREAGIVPELERRRSWGGREFKAFADAFDREFTKILKLGDTVSRTGHASPGGGAAP